ncbi:MAG: glycosyltransferase [Flavobacteriales bacterium]|nr:glycosyltransferase [Flavobacteriales bacterium]
MGGLSGPRGIKNLIAAVGRVEGACLWLLGDWSADTFKRECEAMPGYAKTTWHGKVRMDEVYRYLRAADLGACVLQPLPNYVVSEPIKTWEYLACGLPLLLSDFPLWKAVFHQWSWYADPMDVAAIADAITRSMTDPAERATMARAGREAVELTYAWEHERTRLIDLYRRLDQMK